MIRPRHHDSTLLVDSRCILGEGLSWWAREQAWLWTDIERSCLWLHRPSDRYTRSFTTPDRVGTFVLCESGAVLLGLAKGLGFASLDVAGRQALDVEVVAPVEADLATTRVNDGRTDRSGALVFGTYNEAGDGPRGSLYQYTRAHGLRRLDVGHVSCANSICFSADGATMFFCDSPTRRIMRCDYHSERASIGNAKTFVELGPGAHMPDGSVVDRDGGLWNAEWGSGMTRRYDASGRVTDIITLGAPHTTCPAFGGADFGDLCVTSARTALSSEEAPRFPTAGGLFYTRADGLRGIPDRLFQD